MDATHLVEGPSGSILFSTSALFWAVLRPPNPGGHPQKNSYLVLHYLVGADDNYLMVFRPVDRFSAVFGLPGTPQGPS